MHKIRNNKAFLFFDSQREMAWATMSWLWIRHV